MVPAMTGVTSLVWTGPDSWLRQRGGLEAPGRQGCEERLGHRVVVRVVDGSHRGLDARLSTTLAERHATILAALIGVMNHRSWLWPSDRRLQGRRHELGSQRSRGRKACCPADDPTALDAVPSIVPSSCSDLNGIISTESGQLQLSSRGIAAADVRWDAADPDRVPLPPEVLREGDRPWEREGVACRLEEHT